MFSISVIVIGEKSTVWLRKEVKCPYYYLHILENSTLRQDSPHLHHLHDPFRVNQSDNIITACWGERLKVWLTASFILFLDQNYRRWKGQKLWKSLKKHADDWILDPCTKSCSVESRWGHNRDGDSLTHPLCRLSDAPAAAVPGSLI